MTSLNESLIASFNDAHHDHFTVIFEIVTMTAEKETHSFFF